MNSSPQKTEAIIQLLQQQELNLTELAYIIGKATCTIERAVAKLKQRGSLNMLTLKKGIGELFDEPLIK